MSIITNHIDRRSIQNNEQENVQTNQCHGRLWEVGKEITTTVLPFLALYKPLSFPIAIGMGALRLGILSAQLVDAVREGSQQKIFSAALGTTVAVISLAGTFFAHPLGMLISTGYDLILEFRDLIHHLREGRLEQALQSCLKILGHSLYFAVLLCGGVEISICFFAVQFLMGALEARNEFIQGHYIAGVGHALMAILRGGQLVGQMKTLQLKWETQNLLKKIASTNASDPAFSEYVGKLAEKWQFPSDHLPVGAKVGNAHVITWNILNNHFINWVTELDSQGLKGSLISKLNEQRSLKHEGLTMRDELILSYLQQMMAHSPHRDQLILSLQECSPEFINAFKTTIPSHMSLVLSQNPMVSKDHNIVVYNKQNFDYLKDQSTIDKPFIISDPKRTLMNLIFLEKSTQEKFQIINAHIPGDPEQPGRNEFAKYVLIHMKPGHSTIALGDMNFTDVEMQKAFDDESILSKVPNPFKNLAYYNTNISPFSFYAKPIDHIWVSTKLPCESMRPDEVIPGLQATVDLLHPSYKLYWEAMEAEKWEERKKQDLQMQIKAEALSA
jgi:hypothetical protein